MAELNVQANCEGNSLKIKIDYPRIPDLTFNFKLIVGVWEQDVASRTLKKIYQREFHTLQREFVVDGLAYSKMFKVSIKNSYARQPEKEKNLFVFTRPHQQSEQNQESQLESRGELQSVSSYHRSHMNAERGSSRERYRPLSSAPMGRRNRNLDSSLKKENHYNPNKELCNSELLMKTLAQSSRIGNKSQIHKLLLQGRNCRDVGEFINEKQGRRINRKQVMDKKMLVVKGKLLFSQIYKYREGCQFFKNDWHMGPFYSYDHNENEVRRK